MVDLVCKPDVGQTCHATPEHLGAGVPVAVTSQMPAQLAQQAHRLIQTGGQRRGRLGPTHEGAQGFPLCIGEIDRARYLRGLLSEGGQMINSAEYASGGMRGRKNTIYTKRLRSFISSG